MRATGVFSLGILLWGLTAGAMARTFTSTDGRTFEGEITDAGDTEVTIRRTADGRTFKVRPDTLAREDQEEIEKWKTRKALGRITLTAIKNKLESQARSSGGGNSIADSKAQNWCWRITVKNGSSVPVSGLEIQYHQIVERTDRNQGPVKGAAKTVTRNGTGKLKVPDIRPFGSVTVETGGIQVLAYKSTDVSRTATISGDSVFSIITYKWDEALSGLGVQLLQGPDILLKWKTGTDPGVPRPTLPPGFPR